MPMVNSYINTTQVNSLAIGGGGGGGNQYVCNYPGQVEGALNCLFKGGMGSKLGKIWYT